MPLRTWAVVVVFVVSSNRCGFTVPVELTMETTIFWCLLENVAVHTANLYNPTTGFNYTDEADGDATSALAVQTGAAGVCQGDQLANAGLHSAASLSLGYNARQATVTPSDNFEFPVCLTCINSRGSGRTRRETTQTRGPTRKLHTDRDQSRGLNLQMNAARQQCRALHRHLLKQSLSFNYFCSVIALQAVTIRYGK